MPTRAAGRVRPVIWQEREPYDFQTIMDKNDQGVFMSGTYLYGIRARVNAGFGPWQRSPRSHAALSATNYAAARQTMMALRGDNGRVSRQRRDFFYAPPA